MIKLYNGIPGTEDLTTLMNEIGEECKPFRLMLTTVDCVELYRVFFNRPNPPKGTWMEIDSIGNVWFSSKKEGRRYDCIPHGDIESMLKEKSHLENYIDYIGVNMKFSGPYLLAISLPTDKDHEQALKYTYVCEAASKLRASKNRKTFEETIHY